MRTFFPRVSRNRTKTGSTAVRCARPDPDIGWPWCRRDVLRLSTPLAPRPERLLTSLLGDPHVCGKLVSGAAADLAGAVAGGVSCGNDGDGQRFPRPVGRSGQGHRATALV